MRIVCPSCQATYEVPDSALARGPRAVRCARCGTEWTPEPGATAPAPVAAAPPEIVPPEIVPPEATQPPEPPAPTMPPLRPEPRLTSYRPRTGQHEDDESLPPRDDELRLSRHSAMIAWIVSVVLLAVIGWAAVAWRTEVMAAWPPSERLYVALGLR